MLKRSLFIAFTIVSQLVVAQRATITVESRDILTYPYSDPNPVPHCCGRKPGNISLPFVQWLQPDRANAEMDRSQT